ncbi:hypothetical protein J1605_011832 [Eschrichtius robustus]|uniref:Uncharacterized protein n=1 Tax=Eschrichtius robustus TaxID=9764 RepID=A0AB34GP70_ESCRO|nr:hypothetical protein J1605_011832 [Eschrichtius robustus]
MAPPAMLHLCPATARPKLQVNLLLSTGISTLESPPHTPGSWVPEALDRPSAAKPSEQQGKPPAPHARAKSHRNQGQTSSRLSQPELPHSKFLFLRTLPLVTSGL